MSLSEAAAALDKLLFEASGDADVAKCRYDDDEDNPSSSVEAESPASRDLGPDLTDLVEKTFVRFNKDNISEVPDRNCTLPFIEQNNDFCRYISTVRKWKPGNETPISKCITCFPAAQFTVSNQDHRFPVSPSIGKGDHYYAFCSPGSGSSYGSFSLSRGTVTADVSDPSSIVKQYLSAEDFSKLKKFDLTNLRTTAEENFSPLDPTKYKTELCRSYQVHGVCKYGLRCNYAHGLHQLKVSFRHGKYKTRNCQSYHETGFCRYGARCSFIHDPEEGIMKCPITEREVLEALHYRPLANYHFASITWRVIDSKYHTPTELHFITPLPATKKDLNSSFFNFPEDVSFESSLSHSSADGESINPSHDIKTLPLKNEANAVICIDEDKLQDSTEMISDISDELPRTDLSIGLNHAEQNGYSDQFSALSSCWPEDVGLSPTSHDTVKANIKKTGNTLFHDSKFRENSDTQDEKASLIQFSDSKRSKSSLSHKAGIISLPQTNLCISHSVKGFKLEDFLRCLKTREGHNHLAPWSDELEKKCSSVNSLVSNTITSPSNLACSVCKESSPKATKDMSKYKTELCRSYQYNQFCEYGDLCLYAHGTKDLKSYPKHPMYRTKKCFSFHYKGFCLYGSRCQFLHDIECPIKR